MDKFQVGEIAIVQKCKAQCFEWNGREVEILTPLKVISFQIIGTKLFGIGPVYVVKPSWDFKGPLCFEERNLRKRHLPPDWQKLSELTPLAGNLFYDELVEDLVLLRQLKKRNNSFNPECRHPLAYGARPAQRYVW